MKRSKRYYEEAWQADWDRTAYLISKKELLFLGNAPGQAHTTAVEWITEEWEHDEDDNYEDIIIVNRFPITPQMVCFEDSPPE